MNQPSIAGCRILLVEDEYLLADELGRELEDAGASVLGPAGTVGDAMALIRSEPELDGAILDVNLGGEMVFDVADLLLHRSVPVMFTTGYDHSALPQRFADVVRCEKPVDLRKVMAALGRILGD